ncbi:MAG: hypothetical protein ROW48_04760 [Bellilinea sp.]|jgi:hypothetical protein
MYQKKSRLFRQILSCIALGLLSISSACQSLPPPVPTPQVKPTESDIVAFARQALLDYYTLLQQGEYDQAVAQLLPLSGYDRQVLTEAARQASQSGWQIEEVQIRDAILFDPQRVIFRIAVQQKGPQIEPAEFYQVVHLVEEKALISSGVLGEYSLTSSPVTKQAVNLVPISLHHGVDYYQIWLLAQNNSPAEVVWGKAEPCAVLKLEGDSITAECPVSALVIESGEQATLSLVFRLPEGSYPCHAFPTLLNLEGFSSDSHGRDWRYQFRLSYTVISTPPVTEAARTPSPIPTVTPTHTPLK